MDISISNCNRFIISSGKDAKLIVWDLEELVLLQTLKFHEKQINNIKFYELDYMGKETEFLFSCSDDGLVNIYNFDLMESYREKKERNELMNTRSADSIDILFAQMDSLELT